jgi:Bacterial inner membrane protein
VLTSIGWVATAVFAASYLCKDQATLRRVQAAAAVLWVVYGALIGASPVVVANLIVAGVALWSSLPRQRPSDDDRDVVAAAGLERLPQ